MRRSAIAARLKDVGIPVGIVAGLIVACIVGYFVWRSYGEIVPGLRLRVELGNCGGSDSHRKEASSRIRKELIKKGLPAYEGKFNRESPCELVATVQQSGSVPCQAGGFGGPIGRRNVNYPIYQLTLELRDSQGRTLDKSQTDLDTPSTSLFDTFEFKVEGGESVEDAVAGYAIEKAAWNADRARLPLPDGNSYHR